MATQTVRPIVQDGHETRVMTDAELAQNALDQVETAARNQAAAEKVKAKQAVLDRLGITADEAALLLG